MLAGDWHGNADWAEEALTHALDNNTHTVIQLGDFGWWVDNDFTDYYLSTVQEFVYETGIAFYWLDGNHEDFSRPFNDVRYPNIYHLPRGARWSWYGKRWMALGGAVSVDKSQRTPGATWWPEETLTYSDLERACARPHNVDIVLAHDCPSGVVIPGIGAAGKVPPSESFWPPEVLREAEGHRDMIREVWLTHQPKLWVHGHYHRSYEYWLRETRFVGLDRDTTTLEKNTMFLTADSV